MIRTFAKFCADLSEFVIEFIKIVSLFLVASILSYIGITICTPLLYVVLSFGFICFLGAWGAWYLKQQ